MSRFDYVNYDDVAAHDQAAAKTKCQDLETLINSLGPGRSQSVAHTKLEECYMWIGKAIRDVQIQRNGSAELQGAN